MGKALSATPTQAVAYFRVSTQRQGTSGLGLEAQRSTVETFAADHGLDIVGSFTEIETGTSKRKRVVIQAAIADAKARGARLLIAKLDRLARNVYFISELMESKVDFVACDMPDVTPFTIHILAAVAENEARDISSRTKAALAAAKARGTILGTPANLTPEARARSALVNHDAAVAASAQLSNYIAMQRAAGQSWRKVASRLNSDGFKTRRGRPWHASQARRAYLYAQAAK